MTLATLAPTRRRRDILYAIVFQVLLSSMIDICTQRRSPLSRVEAKSNRRGKTRLDQQRQQQQRRQQQRRNARPAQSNNRKKNTGAGGYGGGTFNFDFGGSSGGKKKKKKPNHRQGRQRQQQQQHAGYGNGHQQQRNRQQSRQNGDPSKYYKILGLPMTAKAKDIKVAYRKLALKHHPGKQAFQIRHRIRFSTDFFSDKFKQDPMKSESQNEELKKKHNDRFIKVAAAYDILGDQKTREIYDKYGQNGLDAHAKGIDPEAAGFRSSFGSSGSQDTSSGGAHGDPFSHMFNFGNRGGFGGGGQRSRQDQTKRKESPPVFVKDDPSGVVPLGKSSGKKSKFPGPNAKHAWLILIYDKAKAQNDQTQKTYVNHAKQLAEKMIEKAKGNKDGVTYKVGAVDCSGDSLQFCRSKIGKNAANPAFATVLNGSVEVITDSKVLTQTKKIHEYTTSKLLGIENLIVNVNSIEHIRSRLFAASPTRGHPNVAIMLLTNKYDTSAIYASVAYRHRHAGFIAFGESRGGNLAMGKEFSVSKYPLLIAMVGDEKTVTRYSGESFDGGSLSKWLDSLSEQYFKTSSSSSSRRKR